MAAPIFAQLPPYTLAVSATRSINLQPDQVVFGLTVGSSAAATLDQIVAALSGLGITSSNLLAFLATPRPQPFSGASRWSRPFPTYCDHRSLTNSSKLSLKTTAALR